MNLVNGLAELDEEFPVALLVEHPTGKSELAGVRILTGDSLRLFFVPRSWDKACPTSIFYNLLLLNFAGLNFRDYKTENLETSAIKGNTLKLRVSKLTLES